MCKGALTKPEAFQAFITIFKWFQEYEINHFIPVNQGIQFVLKETGI